MKIGLYARLAWEGLSKNSRLYLPYLMACTGMVMMSYILCFLEYSPVIEALPGGATIHTIMEVGTTTILFFSTLFLFYTNAFLIKRRKKEFGLYHILGMGKQGLSRILFWETLYTALISLTLGLLLGAALAKLAELGMVQLMAGTVDYSLTISVEAFVGVILPFGLIYLLLYLNTLRQIWFSSSVSLLKSENTGEKAPRANWILGLAGAALLAGAYYLAVTIKDPVSAIKVFMMAVLMVIAGTYLLMISTSVLLCRVLQKWKSYYYQASHFVSISSMAFRMKRNGAGLASVCVLSTMVLVMLASTSTLFIGGEDVILARYPKQINLWFRMNENQNMSPSDQQLFEQTIDKVLEAHGTTAQDAVQYHSIAVSGLLLEDGQVIFNQKDFGSFDMQTFADVHQIYLTSLEDYNTMMHTNETLAEDEVLIYAPRDTFEAETFQFAGQKVYQVKEIVQDGFISPDMAMDIVSALMVIANDPEEMAEHLVHTETDINGNQVTTDLTVKKWYSLFDTTLDEDGQIALGQDLNQAINQLQSDGHDTFVSSVETRAYERKDFYSLYGGLFYLGILLSIVFIAAATLIIYYKQITEGYEDQSRFEIMQKVGMTKKDIRRSINSQLLLVFFLPLGLAGLNLLFAFPVIEKLLLLFNMKNHTLFVLTTALSFCLFALFYVLIYKLTTNEYYKIVSESRT